ncbi:MAG TPA: ATP-binding cassette domain-containing protein [Terriglobales bacterium]|nr:ATP-binding cassette domain-containing protein [Terriglobales bacterium]
MKHRQGQPNPVQALDAVTLSVQAGEFVSVLGRAGSGKTTLLQCIGLVLRPTAGMVALDGIDTGALSNGQRAELRGRRVGFVLRDRNLLPGLTVLENVLLPLRYAGLAMLGRPGRARARDLLDLVGLADLARARPAELTVAQAQRAAIARALVQAPTLVLADEPTGEVDSETSDELLYLMQQVNRMSDVTFIVATQDYDVASCMDRMIRLGDGRVISDERMRVA